MSLYRQVANRLNMEKIIKVENLIYEYQSFSPDEKDGLAVTALDGVNIDISPGEFVAVLGHNGSGKSTLAKQINCLLQPTKGTVWVKGLSTAIDDNIWNIRQSVGMVFQNPDNQIIATIVEEDVAFGPENLGIEPKEIRRRVDEALQAVGMSDFRESAPHHLSGGQKQRIAIAGILAMRPNIILLDEPTAMLDPIGRKEVISTVRRLNRDEGITVVLITHYMDEAAQADRVIVMDEGKISMQGSPKEVFSDIDALKAIGLDVPQTTEIAHRLRLRGCELDEGILSVEELVDALCQLK